MFKAGDWINIEDNIFSLKEIVYFSKEKNYFNGRMKHSIIIYFHEDIDFNKQKEIVFSSKKKRDEAFDEIIKKLS